MSEGDDELQERGGVHCGRGAIISAEGEKEGQNEVDDGSWKERKVIKVDEGRVKCRSK